MSHAIQTKPSYEEAIQSLGTLIPELLGVPGMPRRKFSLDEIRILSAALGNPHTNFPSVLVAGTNGKGSTSATLASIARASGLRVGLYTSPHLARVNERIRILDNAGAPHLASEMWESGDIPDQTFAGLYFRVLEAAQQQVARGHLATLPSFFEHLTALAFLYFAEEKVDLAVLEVGMGGRLDATNLVDPILSVITDISLDHQEWLGSTIALIAREKAGILRQNGTLITLPQHPEANQAIGEAAVALNVRGISAAQYTPQFHADPTTPDPIHGRGFPPQRRPPAPQHRPRNCRRSRISRESHFPHHPNLHPARNPNHPLARPPGVYPNPLRLKFCNRARLQSCRKRRGKKRGFSPCAKSRNRNHPRRSPQPRRRLGPPRRPQRLKLRKCGCPTSRF